MKFKKIKNTDWFNKDGSYRKSKFRLYCSNHACTKFVVLRWGRSNGFPGGHMAYDKDGDGIDIRNQHYVCKEHQKEFHEKFHD